MGISSPADFLSEFATVQKLKRSIIFRVGSFEKGEVEYKRILENHAISMFEHLFVFLLKK